MSPAARWIIAIVALLVANATAMAVLAVTASARQAQIIPAYYEQAIRHDETAAEAAASRALGWRASVELGRDEIVVELRDAHGAAVDARVELSAYHRARASQRFELALTRIAPGRYRGTLATVAGVHDVIVRAERGRDRFVEAFAREVP